jgi:DNA repair protein RadA
MFVVEHADKIVKENNIRLIVVDSLTAHFRSEYLGREMLAERQQRLNKHLHELLRLARMFNAVALITNQIVARPEGGYSLFDWDAAGGHVMAHTSGLRLRLRRAGANTRIVTVVDSSWIPWGECPIRITEKGIDDPEAPQQKVEQP